MTRTKEEDELLEKLAKKHDLPVELIEKACYGQFEFIAKTIKEGSRQGFRLLKLGKFVVKPSKIIKADEVLNNIDNNGFTKIKQ